MDLLPECLVGGQVDPDALVVIEVLLAVLDAVVGDEVVVDGVGDAVSRFEGDQVLDPVGDVAGFLRQLAVGRRLDVGVPGLPAARGQPPVDPVDGLAPLLDDDDLARRRERKDHDRRLVDEVVELALDAVGKPDLIPSDIEPGTGVGDLRVQRVPGQVVWHDDGFGSDGQKGFAAGFRSGNGLLQSDKAYWVTPWFRTTPRWSPAMIDVALPPTPTNTLVIAPAKDRPFDGLGNVATDPSRFLVVRIGRPITNGSIPGLDGRDDTVEAVAVIDASFDPPTTADDDISIRAESPDNLTAIGVKSNEFVTEWSQRDTPIEAWFDSVSGLLQHADLDVAYRFLDVFTGRLTAVNARGLYHLSPETHDEQAVNTIRPLFDAIVERDDGDGYVVKEW